MNKQKYLEKMNCWDGRLEDLFFELYEELVAEYEPIPNLQEICEAYSLCSINVEESREKQLVHFKDNEIRKYKNLFAGMIDESIQTVAKHIYHENSSLQKGYELLWKVVFENPLLKTKSEKAFALYWIAIDNLMPLISINKATRIDKDEFDSMIDNLEDALKRITYIMNFPFEQTTEVTSLILNEINKHENEKERAILMAYALMKYSDDNE